MERPAPKVLAALVLTLAAATSYASDAWAIFDFNVSPRRGGQHLRIRVDGTAQDGMLLRNEEVNVTINTTENAPYRITETVYQLPTDNRTGKSLPVNSFFQFSPSQTTGRLETQLESPVTPGVNQIYTNTTGESDEFALVFNARIPEDQPGGTYQTQITFTAEALTPGAFTPRTVVMQVAIEIPESFRMEARSSRGGQELDLGRITKERPAATGGYRFSFDSNVGTTFRLTQQLVKPLTSQYGETIGADAFMYSAAGAQSGSLSATGAPRPVSESGEAVYVSDPQGGPDQFEIQYSVSGEGLKAGVYTGQIAFRVESNSPLVSQQTILVPVRLEIQPILYLDIQTQTGQGVTFGAFRPEDVKESRVTLTVNTNLGQEYSVSQIVPRALTGPDGSAIPETNFQYYGSDAKTGVLAARSPVPVKEGETVVFTSDSRGLPETFTLNYTLSIPRDTRAGTYNSEIKYSITTL